MWRLSGNFVKSENLETAKAVSVLFRGGYPRIFVDSGFICLYGIKRQYY